MTEFELKQGLSQEIGLPRAVEERLAQACAQATAEKARPVRRRRPLRAVRIGAAAAAAVAVLSVGAMAASFASHSAVFQGFFGNESHPSLQYGADYDERGLYLMNNERLPVDEEQAEALVGAYLPEESYTWQIGAYTLTVESYLLDENTGTAKVNYSLHRPGGLEGITVDRRTGCADFYGKGSILPSFRALCSDPESPFYGEYLLLGEGGQVDLARSTEDTLYLTESLTLAPDTGWADGGWKAADGLRIEVFGLRFAESDVMADMDPLATLDLPGLESLPAVTLADPETGEPAAVISAIAMKLPDSPRLDYDTDISVTLDDGSTYVVYDFKNHLGNNDSISRGEGTLRVIFNRLVDPARVASVTVDGVTYAVNG